MPHLLVAITGHGFGHAAQTAPVIDALRARRPELRISVRSDLPPARLAQFFPGAESVTRPVSDFGIPMRSAIDVDADAAERAFSRLHREFDATVAAEAAALAALRPDLVLANVGFVPIAAAARAGIPAIGFSSLNWLGILRGYAGGWRAAEAILAEIAASYRLARIFVQPTPTMPMPELACVQVGPVARQGVAQRARLAARLGLAAGERVVLLSLGGIETSLDLAAWPAIPGVRYVVAALATPARPDMAAAEALDISHLDCLASCDAVITKPGYGMVSETACNGVPVLFVRRGSWPEEPHLVDWWVANATALEIARATLEQGTLAPALTRLWTLPRRPAVAPTGGADAARILEAAL